MAKGTNFWDDATTRHNMLRRYTAEQINGTAFDPDSIMLYFFPAEWTLNGIATKANETLSTVDKAFIAGAKMYPRNRPIVTQATPLSVNARQRTSAAIGQFGEADLFSFKAAVEGSHVIDTQGPTDVVMKLFGPNSETNVIAEDDDSGLGSNARIAQRLIAGDYFIQIRHFNRDKGVGDYSIKLRRSA